KEAAEKKENQEVLRKLADLKLLSTEAPLAGPRPLAERSEEGGNASSPAAQAEKRKDASGTLPPGKNPGGLEKIPEGVIRQP
ncbi:MAG: hypothetical protein J6331_05510, partial [Lentisphaeria bacterium]|nr:hypothetical protein [Lentisphaeria bacterium]